MDRILLEGINRGTFTTLGEIARICEVRRSAVAAKAWALFRNRRGMRWAVHPTFLSQAFVHDNPDPPPHGWLSDRRATLPGVRYLLSGVLATMNHLEGSHRALQPGLAYPLMSGRVIEAAVAIPSWRNCRGGMTRAVARQAFADILPAGIAQRRGKGTFDGLTFDILHRNRTTIRSMLLDGRLCADGIADREAIEHFFASERLPSDVELIRLLALADCEAWINALALRAPPPAAPVQP